MINNGAQGDGEAVATGAPATKPTRLGGRNFTLTIEGLDRLDMLLTRSAREANMIVGRAVNEEVQLMASAAITRTPKRHGYLRSSQSVLGPVEHGRDHVESTITYGSTAAWYAWLVHEREYTATGKPINYRVGGSKYLSKTVDAALPVLGDRIGRRVQAIIDGLI